MSFFSLNWLYGICGIGKKEKSLVEGVRPRIISLIKCHFRGLLTFIICLAVWLAYGSHENRAVYMFIVMIVLFTLKPIAVSTTGLIPIFYMPMTGLLITHITTKFFNSAAALWVLGSMMHLLLNSTDVDDYVATKILSYGSFTPRSMVFKAGLAAFFMSIFSNRLQVSSKMTSLISSSDAQDPQTKTLKNVLNSVIVTSSTIGGFVVVHGSIAPIIARTVWTAYNKDSMSWNYAQYTYFTFPISIGMFAFNLICHFIYLKVGSAGGGPAAGLEATINSRKSEMGKLTGHQLLTIIFTVAFYIVIMSRRIHYSMLSVAGWQPPSNKFVENINDITVIAAFVVSMSILPRSLNFLKVIRASNESDLPPNKPDSAILLWKYTDKNVIYTYILLLVVATVQVCALSDPVAYSKLVGLYYDLKGLTIVRVIICVIAANVMGDAAAAFICCIVLSIAPEPIQVVDPDNPVVQVLQNAHKIQLQERYPFMMVCAVACNLCFTSPFINTPAFFCKKNGNVPILTMIAYAIPSLLGCSVILWLGVEYFIKYTYLTGYTLT